MIEFRQPTEKQVEEVQLVASLLEQVMELIIRHGGSREASAAYDRAQECLMWFNAAVMKSSDDYLDLQKMN
jgi:hypothetical protein